MEIVELEGGERRWMEMRGAGVELGKEMRRRKSNCPFSYFT